MPRPFPDPARRSRRHPLAAFTDRRGRCACLLAALAALLCAPATPARAQGAPIVDAPEPIVEGDAAQRIDAFLTALTEQGFAGAALAALDGEVVLAKGYGLADPTRGIANTPLTVFPTASLTKQFTGAAIVALEEDGLLSVDDPISRWLDDVPDDKTGITIHQLLTHTSGLPEGIGDDHEPVTRDAMIAEALAQPLAFEPGSDYLYSDPGYTLLAAIVEIASGTSNDAWLKTRLFGPAGMTRSGYVVDVPAEELAHGVDPLGGGDLGTRFDRAWTDDGPWWYLRGTGGVHTTVLDMFRWDRALAAGTVLSDASTAELFGRHAQIEPGVFYGYGWGVVDSDRGTTVHTHLGGSEFGSAFIRRYPDEGAFLYLVSNSPVRVDGFASELARALLDPNAPLEPPDLSPVADLPDTPAGRAAAALTALIANPDPDAVRDFVTTRMDEGFQRDASPEEWTAFFEGLALELPEPVAGEVRAIDPYELSFTVRSATTGAARTFLLLLEPRPPHRLNGLDVR